MTDAAGTLLEMLLMVVSYLLGQATDLASPFFDYLENTHLNLGVKVYHCENTVFCFIAELAECNFCSSSLLPMKTPDISIFIDIFCY